MKKTLHLIVCVLAFGSLSAQFSDDFEGGSLTANHAWEVIDVVNDKTTDAWYYDNYSGDNFAEASGYEGSAQNVDSWLVSPAINLTTMTTPILTFQNAANFDGLDIEVYVSITYGGSGTINIGDWTELTGFNLSGGSYAEVGSGDIDLSAYKSTNTYIAFRYLSNPTDGSTTWQIDDISIVDGGTPPPAQITIAEVQATTGGDASDMEGDEVTVGGIVSAVATNGFYIQDNPGAWNGIYIFDNGENTVARGDSVIVTGTVTEWDFSGASAESATQITNLTAFANEGAYTPHPASALSTANVNDEGYESVLVSVSNAEVQSGPDDFNEWVINDGTGNVNVDDFMYETTPDPVVGEVYDVTGPVGHNFGAFKILPRDASDVEKKSSVSVNENSKNTIEIYPNPSSGDINVVNIDNSTIEVYNTLGELVITTTNTKINLPAAGLYIVKVGDYTERVIIK